MIDVLKLANLPTLPRLVSPTARLALTPAVTQEPVQGAVLASTGLKDRLVLVGLLRDRLPPIPVVADTTASLVQQARRLRHQARCDAEEQALSALSVNVEALAKALED